MGKTIKKGLNGTQIKLLAVILMLCDHIGASILEVYCFGETLTDSNVALVVIYYTLRIVGRLSFPIFVFFLVEGFMRTKSKWKYALRLFAFALISEIPFDLALFGKAFYIGYQNVYFTLLIGMLVLWGINQFCEKRPPKVVMVLCTISAMVFPGMYIAQECSEVVSIFFQNDVLINFAFFITMMVCAIAVLVLILVLSKRNMAKAYKFMAVLGITGAGMFLADLLMTDYSSNGILVIVILYLLRSRRVLGLVIGGVYLGLMNFAEWPALLAIPFLARYNGERGKGFKYFFYAFYPIHLLILGIICKIMGIR